MDDIDHLYLYRTGREDGMEFCVGAHFREGGEGRVDGMVALFQTHHAATIWLDAMHAKYGMAILLLPSAQV